jgi:uncharacterized protein YlzI (FlbEa/FlbD family)
MKNVELIIKNKRKDIIMSIKLKDRLLIGEKVEEHFKVEINEKEIWINRWKEIDNELAITDGDIEIIKGEKLLTEEEKEEVIDYINDLD